MKRPVGWRTTCRTKNRPADDGSRPWFPPPRNHAETIRAKPAKPCRNHCETMPGPCRDQKRNHRNRPPIGTVLGFDGRSRSRRKAEKGRSAAVPCTGPECRPRGLSGFVGIRRVPVSIMAAATSIRSAAGRGPSRTSRASRPIRASGWRAFHGGIRLLFALRSISSHGCKGMADSAGKNFSCNISSLPDTCPAA
jgi:hypothetical protein